MNFCNILHNGPMHLTFTDPTGRVVTWFISVGHDMVSPYVDNRLTYRRTREQFVSRPSLLVTTYICRLMCRADAASVVPTVSVFFLC